MATKNFVLSRNADPKYLTADNKRELLGSIGAVSVAESTPTSMLNRTERLAITNGVVGATWVTQTDLPGIAWKLIAADATLDASWQGFPYTTNPDGSIAVTMELADVGGTVPDANVLGQVHGRPTIGDDVTTGGKRLAMPDDLLDLTLLVDTADAVTGFALDAIPDDWKSGVTTITAAHIGNSVTSIGSTAFYGCTSLTSITIGNSVTSIGDGAFYSCTALTSVTIPNSVTSIGSYAFNSCTALTSITIPDSVTSIEDGALGITALTSITIPNSITTIGNYAFYYCAALTSITIPDSVTSIGNSAFDSCTSLTSVTITSVPAAAWTGVNGLFNTPSLTDINITADVFNQYDGAWRTAQGVDPSVTLNSI